ncbi:MAG: UDP-N-acetylmuramoyl-L-alanyl-D-glutamate--2,6-diaminopimelate ligase [Marinilabiliaceae bacterium]|jgi:UDP-N-acetylmuramoyl-L-alanyl-D-glutamate--2,6-diaminopimelate ligase|nr:UDP-N-acetylmuramoyl-L-alanyl-D-glutamate--2,6-diaminopimelate ligase [Marinilabiliaceae bacterium]
MRKLKEILSELEIRKCLGDTNIDVSGICFDSREAAPGNAFVAVRGTITDGHKYILAAIGAGVSAIVCEELPADADDKLCWVVVENSARALAYMSSAFYNHPSSRIRLVGVTGTNGKTTIASLLYKMFLNLGYRAGLLSTIGNMIFRDQRPASHTTPDPLQINRLLSEMADAGCEYAFMEVSSIALHQHRTEGLCFDGAVFTNLSHDHLDYHGNFDSYIAAKKLFFDSLAKESFALVNADDRRSSVMVQNTKASVSSYALKRGADFKCRILEERFEGMLLNIDGTEVSTSFIGDFNASNLLAVYAVSVLLGANKTEALTSISTMTPVDGRLEIIRDPKGKTAIVDYAHTPDALENVLSAINRIRRANEAVITVVGAGGDRDRSKRPLMAAIAAEKSDRVILTSDNPRSEDPDAIIADMMKGVAAGRLKNVLSISSRSEAIKTALMLAGDKDIVLVAGKGHETYQEVKGTRSHFDDREEIKKYMNQSQTT